MTTWQLTIDCTHPPTMVRFWTEALGYRVEPPPEGFATWNDWYRSFDVPEDDLEPDGDGSDRIIDAAGHGPRIWFQKVPEGKTGKNRLHLDVFVTEPGAAPDTRRRDVDRRAAELVAKGATRSQVFDDTSSGHYHVVMHDPEGNEFCIV